MHVSDAMWCYHVLVNDAVVAMKYDVKLSGRCVVTMQS